MTIEPEPTTLPEREVDPSWSLQVLDIENAVKVIDYAADQGAYKGWSVINEVLNIRNKLVLFLRTAAEAQAQAEEEDKSTTEPPSEDIK